MHSRERGWIVLALFFCSGATALVYEVVWSKLLSQMFGSTIYAQTVVLAVFMGGLALGNRMLGVWADRLQQPVRAYGCLEIAIGIYAFFFLTFDRAADHLFVGVGSHIVERPGLLLALKGVLSAGLLLGPTILMGGTLPLLAAWLQKSSLDAGRRSARFYSVNSLGAVAGAALAGFWLVQSFGIVGTLRITGVVNVIVGAVAILLSRGGLVEQHVHAAPSEPVPGPEAAAPGTLHRAGLIVASTGAVSMGLELVSSRSLALIFGSSLQTFAVVLMAFILGIGLGSAWIASPRRKGGESERRIVVLLCLAAAWVVLLVFNIERWVDLYRIARTGLARTPAGYVFHELFTVAMALVILGLPAAWVGAVLPLMIRAVAHEGSALGARVGGLLTWNTLGAVGGTLTTGFVLMPLVGLRNSFGVLALVLALAALVVAWSRRWRPGMAAGAGVVLFAGCLFVFGDAGWQCVISSGVFRAEETQFDPAVMGFRKAHVQVLFYNDAPDATVSVEQDDGVMGKPDRSLRINGKTEASTGLDFANQLLLAHLPLLAKPDARDVFVLGLGSGMTAGAVLAYPSVGRIDLAENCEPVIQASRLFEDWNRHVIDNPRTHLWPEDARTMLKLRPQLYDVIVTEPSNPWTVGVGSVFSREYYELAARRLKPNGIVAQWFHLYEMNEEVLRLVLRTFGSTFPCMEVWDAGTGDIIILGSKRPWPSGPDLFRRGFAIERVRTDMNMIEIRSPEALLARQLASQRTAFAIVGDGPIQSDLHPILEYAAPRAQYMGYGCRMLDRFDERTRQQLLGPRRKREVLGALSPARLQFLFSAFSSVNGELLNCVLNPQSNPGVPCVFQTQPPSPPPAPSGTALDEAGRAFSAGNLERAAALAAQALKLNPGDPEAAYVERVVARERRLQHDAGLAGR